MCYNEVMIQVSIIIPVYNAEKHLERCVDSVLKAVSGIHSEILLIDNNSTDKSVELIQKYRKKYPGVIRAMQCLNPGAGTVRNFGVTEARGKYIWFVDADDEVTKDSVSKLLTAAEQKKADLTMLGMKRIYQDGHTDYLSAVRPDEDNYKSRFVRYGLGPVQAFSRRAWWIQCGFKFKEGIIQEDMEMMSALILYTDKYAAVDEPIYLYYQNEDSVLHKTSWDPHAFDIFPALEGLYQRFVKAGAEKTYHDELEWFFIWNLLIDSAKDFDKFPEGKPGFQRSREMMKKYFPKWRKNRFLKQKPLKFRMRVKLNYKK